MLLALAVGLALADPDTCRATADAGPFDAAVEACRACVDAPGRDGLFCAGRVEDLELRRDRDGTFTTWTALQDVRRAYRELDGDEARRRVDALAGLGSPTVRAEVAVWRARDEVDPTRVLAILDDWPDDVAEVLQRQRTQLRAEALARIGEVDQARTEEATILVPAAVPRPTRVDEIVTRRQRRWGAAGAGLALGAFGAVALPLAVRGWWPRPRPVPLGVFALLAVTAGAWAIVEGYAGAGASLVVLALGWTALHLVSAGALLAVRGPFRTAVGGLAALATLGLGYLVLWWYDDLSWVGL